MHKGYLLIVETTNRHTEEEQERAIRIRKGQREIEEIKQTGDGSRMAELFIWALTWTTDVYLLFRLSRLTMIHWSFQKYHSCRRTTLVSRRQSRGWWKTPPWSRKLQTGMKSMITLQVLQGPSNWSTGGIWIQLHSYMSNADTIDWNNNHSSTDYFIFSGDSATATIMHY